MRLDQYLTAEGHCDSRSRAQALIAAGVVLVNGVAAKKPSQKVAGGDVVEVTANPNPWVSRAALKLAHALEVFDLHPSGIALDVGASTGGFTEVLLANGIDKVLALDVGHGQLHPKIAADPRVVNMEGTNARAVSDLPPLDWVVSDVSFISLEKALPRPLEFARAGAILVALIKPQFEVGPDRVGKGGIVKDQAAQAEVRARIEAFLDAQGWDVTHRAESPILGSDGNREFLIAARKR